MISQTYFSPSGEHFDLSTRGSRGVKQKGSRRWKGSEKVVINEETMDGGRGVKGCEAETVSYNMMKTWRTSADIFFSFG